MARFGYSGPFDDYEDYQLAQNLWDRSTAESDYYADLEDYQQRELANQFEQTIFDGDYEAMQSILDELGIEWDADDWADWRELYDSTH